MERNKAAAKEAEQNAKKRWGKQGKEEKEEQEVKIISSSTVVAALNLNSLLRKMTQVFMS